MSLIQCLRFKRLPRELGIVDRGVPLTGSRRLTGVVGHSTPGLSQKLDKRVRVFSSELRIPPIRHIRHREASVTGPAVYVSVALRFREELPRHVVNDVRDCQWLRRAKEMLEFPGGVNAWHSTRLRIALRFLRHRMQIQRKS